jgi:hypothetical protein
MKKLRFIDLSMPMENKANEPRPPEITYVSHKEFLETLKALTESKDLWVELRPGRPSYMVLKGTYGDRIHEAFRMTRQGVRWRFQRLLGDIYVSAFETILLIEKTFGTHGVVVAVRRTSEDEGPGTVSARDEKSVERRTPSRIGTIT